MVEAAAEASEELMDKYLGGEELTEEEIIEGLRQRRPNPMAAAGRSLPDGSSSRMQAGVLLRATASSAAPSAKQITL